MACTPDMQVSNGHFGLKAKVLFASRLMLLASVPKRALGCPPVYRSVVVTQFQTSSLAKPKQVDKPAICKKSAAVSH